MAELLRPAGMARPADSRSLQIAVLEAGEIVADLSLETARRHHVGALAELPTTAHDLAPGEAFIPTHLLEEPTQDRSHAKEHR
jgi:hypothetical protein